MRKTNKIEGTLKRELRGKIQSLVTQVEVEEKFFLGIWQQMNLLGWGQRKGKEQHCYKLNKQLKVSRNSVCKLKLKTHSSEDL